MKTLIEVLKASCDYLAKAKIDEPRREAEYLIADALHISRMQLYLEYDRPLEETELADLRERLKRRAKHEPVQYIAGEVDFYGCKIKVNPSVLIPRQETEILVDLIAKEFEQVELKHKRLLDLCTGSGCIGIALKKRFPDLEVLLSDLSPSALTVAKENAHKNGVEVQLLRGNLFEPLQGQKVDFIVCNPPYISQKEYDALALEVREFEPRDALLAGPTGMEIYQALAVKLAAFLAPGGKVWFEIGAAQGGAIKALFLNPIWKRCDLKKDWAGQDRFFSFEKDLQDS